MMQSCNFQDRYLKHQADKKSLIDAGLYKDKKQPNNNFESIIRNRKSDRIFCNKKITLAQIRAIEKWSTRAPSSCNRQAVYIRTVNNLKDLEPVLVGGRGWIDKASVVMLFFAKMEAYKSPNEVLFMPFLDAGVKVMLASLVAESMGIKNCIVNPNIRPENELAFRQIYNKDGDKFCVALALGL